MQTHTSNINQGNCYPLTTEVAHFTPVTGKQLSRMIKYIPSKSCELDPFPASVLKRCLHILLPVITKIVNLSLNECVVPSCLKVAVLNPSLKKSSLDHEEFRNFRPISNLNLYL